MTTKSMAYDNPTYTSRNSESMGEIGGAATTQYAKFVAFTASLAFSAQLTVTTAGTSAANNTVAFSKISGTSTTALATATLGTGAAGTTLNVPLSTSAGGVALAQGDLLVAVTGADATGKAALAYEASPAPGANVTA
ncbi:hypothetical protein [Paraburkholderia rhynchosiae]|uniref:Uncharacterized protein n=1 Tax=Paraburkholderia rhynchosiae TaxID=487049 RepID=A0A2N7W9B9_9BURK|nr:hypothetical protein [Paraburkholderia rhynchosiae]PMS26001.1 hypothetical protein C0Z16_28110 [Paraburkholderia rhynchosiae]CAB3731047.1 hypothetical protein LMG27174_05801 [Paraburkholderia rhynchosiae]